MINFSDDKSILEPYNTIHENFMFWFLKYMANVFSTQSKVKVKDKVLHNHLIKKFKLLNQLCEMGEIRSIINDLSKNGFVGPKIYFNSNVRFYNFLINYEQDSLTKINNSMLRHFLDNEIDDVSFTTKKNIYVCIKNFLIYIEDNNFIEINGEEHTFKLHRNLSKVIRKEKKPIAYLSPHDEYYDFLASIDKTVWRLETEERNKVMLKILLICGIRVDELTSINHKNDLKIIEKDDLVELKITGKGNKKRTVTIAYSLIKQELLSLIRVAKLRNSEYLFNTKNGKKIDNRYLRNIIQNVMQTANIAKKDKNGPHMLRHSCATWLFVVAKFDIGRLQTYMAHEDITTTKKYTHVSDEVVKEMSKSAYSILGKNYEKYKQLNKNV